MVFTKVSRKAQSLADMTASILFRLTVFGWELRRHTRIEPHLAAMPNVVVAGVIVLIIRVGPDVFAPSSRGRQGGAAEGAP